MTTLKGIRVAFGGSWGENHRQGHAPGSCRPNPPVGRTALPYHIMPSVVHHSKIRCRLAAMGQTLPSHLAVVLINVCCSPASDQIPYRLRKTRGATRRHRNGYSITLSAVARSADGIVSASALAVLRLITNSYLAGSWIGSSPGLAPLRMRSMYPAAPLKDSSKASP
jgi:hypothetical protein